MQYEIPYGKGRLQFELPDRLSVQVLRPAAVPVAPDPRAAVEQALSQPVGGVSLQALAAQARSVAIAVSDKTRPVPNAALLPPLLERLARHGIPNECITFLITNGTHPPMQPDEFERILPADLVSRYRIISHDALDSAGLGEVGVTSRGTRVWLNRLWNAADLRIVVGNLEPHQFEGFSGGVKPAAIGLAGFATINSNHTLLLDPRSQIGHYEDNPARQEVEEIGRMIRVDFALNAVVNESKQIVSVLAGDPREVMVAGIPRVCELYQVRVPAAFDLTITTPGGHPKDINLYQAQKALAHAGFVTKTGGTMILAASCPEGAGNRDYEEWVSGMDSHQAVLERFEREGPRIGPHKAFQIARDALRTRVLFVTEMRPEKVRILLLTPVNLEQALEISLRDLPADARIGILPWANATILMLEAE